SEKRNQDTVRMAVQGANRVPSMGRWVKKEDVFTLGQVSRSGASTVLGALIQLEQINDDGECIARLSHRYKDDTVALGYRCMKVDTVHRPLRMRLVQADSRTPTGLAGAIVHVQQQTFQGNDAGREELSTDVDGFFSTKKAYDRVAFVSVQKSGEILAFVPVALVDERVIVTPVRVGAQATDDPLKRQRDLWLRRLYDTL